jgi:peroxiredoxin
MYAGATSAIAAEAKTIPQVGDTAPDFTLNNLASEPVSLAELRQQSSVVLVVLRGYPGYQCPLCSIQMAGLMAKAKELSAAGAKVVMVYPGPAEDLAKRAEEFTKSKALPAGFYFVIDPDYQFTESYGLRWNAPKETAYPSTFVIAQNGTVKFAQVSKTHAGRAAVKDVLAALANP